MNNFTYFKIKYSIVLLLAILTCNSSAISREKINRLSTNTFIAQKSITLNFKNQPISVVLKSIQEQSGIDFVIDENLKNILSSVTINVSNSTVEAALNLILKNSGYSYKITNNLVTFIKIVENSNTQQNNSRKVKGKIIDTQTKAAIVGATVIVKGTTNGAITDEQGNFNITVKNGNELEISCTGMTPITKVITASDDNLTLSMAKDVLTVEDIVVNGYYARSKESLTGSAVVVKGAELQKVSSSNLINALQVFDPSFRVSENVDMGSNPNALPDFRIRGNSGLGVISEGTLKGSPNLPTFILDGYEVDVEKIYDMDLNRVESVTILKDASATAIYGSRAANGVVVVTTKTPEAGKLRVAYNFTGTIQAPDLSDYNLLNAADKLKAEVFGGLYDSRDSEDLEQQLRLDYASRQRSIMEGVDTYWLSQPLRTAFGHKHSLYIDGGDNAVRYAIDVNYQANPGVMKKSNRDRFGAGFQLSYNYKDKLLFKNYITVEKVKSNETTYGAFSEYAKMNPYYRPYDEDGNLIGEYKQNIVVSYRNYNPLYQSTLNNVDRDNQFGWANNFDFDWKIINSIRFKARFAYSEKYSNNYKYNSPKMLEYRSRDLSVFERGKATSGTGRTSSWDTNVVLSYNNAFGNHFLNAVVGGNLIENSSSSEGYNVRGFANEILDIPSYANSFDGSAPDGSEGTTRLASTFANLNYSYNNRYLFDASFRLDGSSMYGFEKRSAPFWSLGLGWNIHHEKFLSKIDVINHLKVTANIGITGKASFAPYESRTSFQYNRTQWYSSSVGATLMAMGNSSLEWEKTTLKDIRLEIGFFNNLIFVSGNYYVKDTKDLLSDVTLPYSSGFKSYKENIGSLKNEGYEISLKAFVLRRSECNINIYGSLAHNKNTIKEISNSLKGYNDEIDDLMNSEGNGSKTKIKFLEGQSTSAIYAVMSHGINPANGKELFINRDGSLSYDWNASQQVVCGDTEPLLSGTLGTNIDYKGFNLNFNFLYEMGGEVYNQTLVDRVENANLRWNVDKRVLNDRWQKPGDVAKFKDIRDQSVSNTSSRFVEKNNLLRLQSLSFSYTLDKELTKKWSIEKVKIGFLMNDVFRAATVKQERGLTYPFARSFNVNLQVQF